MHRIQLNSHSGLLSIRRSRRATFAPLIAGLCLGLVIAGCGRPTPASPVQQAEVSPLRQVGKQERVSADEHIDRGARRQETSKIPYDAFFSDPLEVAQDNAVAGGAAVAPKEVNKPEEKAMPADGPQLAAGGLNWNDFISVDDIQDEVKRIRNRLTGHLAQVGTYNGNYKDIAVDGAVIAALAGIITENGGDVSWKTNAPYIRNFGYDLSQAATGLGKDNFEKSKTAFEKLQSVFSGSVPADAGTAPAKRPFSEVADRSGVMKRIEKGKNWMRDNINNDAKLKGETEAILHEAAMIAALGKVVTLEGYGSADEQDYQQFAKALIDGAKEATAGAKDQSLKKFTDAMNKVSKSCDQCHANYGNG